MALEFPPLKPTYDPVRGVVVFIGWDGDRQVVCGVTKAALRHAGLLQKARRRGDGSVCR
jgi:hypothetical protein